MCFDNGQPADQSSISTVSTDNNTANNVVTPDMTDQYNTKLSTGDETKYKQWQQQQSQIVGRNLSADERDYDMRGFWKANPTFSYADPSQHLNDTYKKPNHPTFSNESIYSGKDGYVGGQWVEDNGNWNYVASPTNLQMRSEADLQEYFKKHEPNSKLDTSKAKKKGKT